MIFFGTSAFSIHVLNRLLEHGITPDVIVTVPDKPQGRKLLLTPPPVKVWAEEHNIPCLQFVKLNEEAVSALTDLKPVVFIVASYGKIIPQSVLDIPTHGCLNVHPSLLPKFRGASPLQTSILNDEQNTGVVIIKMDKEMDHGPIVARSEVSISPWPLSTSELEEKLAYEGADILAKALPSYLDGSLVPEEQDHSNETFTKKIEKEESVKVIPKMYLQFGQF